MKVDLASVVRAGVELGDYHGTDRFAHPSILDALIKFHDGLASAASSSSASAVQSPTSGSTAALRFTPHASHMLYSAAATVLWLIHMPPAAKELVRGAANNWTRLRDAWRKVRQDDGKVDSVLQAAESGDVDKTLERLLPLVEAAHSARARASSE